MTLRYLYYIQEIIFQLYWRSTQYLQEYANETSLTFQLYWRSTFTDCDNAVNVITSFNSIEDQRDSHSTRWLSGYFFFQLYWRSTVLEQCHLCLFLLHFQLYWRSTRQPPRSFSSTKSFPLSTLLKINLHIRFLYHILTYKLSTLLKINMLTQMRTRFIQCILSTLLKINVEETTASGGTTTTYFQLYWRSTGTEKFITYELQIVSFNSIEDQRRI